MIKTNASSLVFFLLFFVSLICLVIGFIKPRLVTWAPGYRNRKASSTIYGLTSVIFMVLWIVFLPPEAPSQVTTSKPQSHAVSNKTSSSSQNSTSNTQSIPGDIQAGDEATINTDEALVATSQKDFDELENDITAGNVNDMQSMVDAGSVIQMPKGTKIYVESVSWGGTATIRMDSGMYQGETGYERSEELTKIK